MYIEVKKKNNLTMAFLRFHFIRIYGTGDRALFRTLSSIENTLHTCSLHAKLCMQ